MKAGYYYQPDGRFQVHTIQSFEEHGMSATAGSKQSPFYKIVWVKNGNGHFITGRQHYEAFHNMVCCFSPEMPLRISGETELEGFFVSITKDTFYAIVKECNLSGGTTLSHGSRQPAMIFMDETTSSKVEAVLWNMRKEFLEQAPMQQEILQGFFRLFLLYLSRTAAPENTAGQRDRESALVRDFRTLLYDHIVTKKLVSDYAQALHVSPGHLNHAVKKVSGYTASYHIQQQIIREAKHLARYSSSSMKEIAYDLGFNDIAHFSKFFKHYSGTSFTDFKRGVCYDNRLSSAGIYAG